MKTVPPCLSGYDAGDFTCNGDPEADSDEARTTCGWRDHCGGFKAYLAETGQKAEDFVTITNNGAAARPRNPKTFLVLLNEQVERFSIVEGIPHRDPKREGPVDVPVVEEDDAEPAAEDIPEAEPGPAPDGVDAADVPTPEDLDPSEEQPETDVVEHSEDVTLVRPRRRRKVPASLEAKRKSARGIADDFIQMVRDGFAELPFVTRANQVVAPGNLYARDRTDTSSGYVRVYQKAQAGWDNPVVGVKLHPYTQKIDVEVPISSEIMRETLAKNVVRKVKMLPLKKGRFLTRITGVDRELAVQVAEALKRLHAKGQMPLMR